MVTQRISITGLALLWILGGLGTPPTAADDFQVNTYTTSFQEAASVDLNANGEMVVVWASYGSASTDTSKWSIQGQRYGADNTPSGGEFQVNALTTTYQTQPDVAVEADGDFVVVWGSNFSSGTDDWDFSIQGRRFASDGSAVGGDFQVNTYTEDFQGLPSVGVDGDGDFVVVWKSDGSYGTDSDVSVQGQRYASDGSEVGGEFQVNTFTTNIQDYPSAAVRADGSFVVVWSVFDPGGLGYAIHGQCFASDGTVAGGEFEVNTLTTGVQGPAVAVDADGDFVVAWSSRASSGTDSSATSIQGQRFASGGTASGGEFQVNTWTTAYQYAPAVAVESDGDFVIVWHGFGSFGTDSSVHSVHGQRYAVDGDAVGGEFQVNTYTTNSQFGASVVVDDFGGITVVWVSGGSTGTDTDDSSIQMGRFISANSAIFANGFESGDVTLWSTSVP